MRYILAGLLLLGSSCPALAEQVVPNFTRGTITATTESTTKIVETIRQVEYTTGTSYTVTGTNINIPGTPQQGANYTIQTQGAHSSLVKPYLELEWLKKHG